MQSKDIILYCKQQFETCLVLQLNEQVSKQKEQICLKWEFRRLLTNTSHPSNVTNIIKYCKNVSFRDFFFLLDSEFLFFKLQILSSFKTRRVYINFKMKQSNFYSKLTSDCLLNTCLKCLRDNGFGTNSRAKNGEFLQIVFNFSVCTSNSHLRNQFTMQVVTVSKAWLRLL